MKITIIYDNEVFKEGLEADWGFACLVEAYDLKILFDTGAKSEILLNNMSILEIEPREVDLIFISHAHWDHTGGLREFLQRHKTKVYIPKSCPVPANAGEIVRVEEPIKIHDNIYSTGELQNVEQSLVIKTDNGVVVIVGCSHSGVENIIHSAADYGKPFAIIGGLHGFNNFDILRGLPFICPTHCTQYKREIRSLYPDTYHEGGAGRVFEI